VTVFVRAALPCATHPLAAISIVEIKSAAVPANPAMKGNELLGGKGLPNFGR
jgi:hypothetical protein